MTEINRTDFQEIDLQQMQDCLWDHYQVEETFSFDLSYPRLDFLAGRFKSGQVVLNIGVGNGYLEEKLYRHGIDIHALDPSKKTIDQLKKKIPLGKKGLVGHCQTIPFPPDYFDGIIMTEVLEHLISSDLTQTLKEVRKALKPGGLMVGTVPFQEDLKANQVICPCCRSLFHRWGHHQSFNKDRLKEVLAEAGFQIIKIHPRTFPDWKRMNLKLFLKSLGRYILGRMGETIVSPNLYFKVRKPSSSIFDQ